MRELRLLERIKDFEKDPERRFAEDPQAMTKSVLHHIQQIMNTRQGSVLIHDDYGVPDFTDIAGSYASDRVQELERDLSKIIMKYEPRLLEASITFQEQQDDVLALRFKIKGKLAMENDVPVVFESVVQSDGRITITD